ncbi:MAG TPA: hypothetical protein VIK25_04145 [Gemmatimonadaceae bacterium]
MRALVASLIAALACWTAFVQWIAPSAPPLPVGAAQNRIVAERLRLDATDSSVLVLGSSMTARLPMSSVAPGAQAVGVSGGTAAMAIELAQSMGRRPRVAVVEANRLAWPSDSSDMRDLSVATPGSGTWRLWRFEYRPSTQALGLIVRVTDLARRVLLSEAGKRVAERRAAAAYGREEVDSAQGQRALDRVRGLLDQWRLAGTTVYLVELPVHPLLAMFPREQRMIGRAFPDSLFPRVRLDGTRMQTTDGRHLENDAAWRVARAIARLVSTQ